MTTDNTNAAAKIELRNLFLSTGPATRILECCAGPNRSMYRACYTGRDVTSLDIKSISGTIRIDNRQYVKNHADEFDFFDVDVYGSPHQLLATLFANRRSSQPFAVVVTDGTGRLLEYGGHHRAHCVSANIPRRMRIPHLHRFSKELVGYFLKALAARYGYTITGGKFIKCKKMMYYGFVARKNG